MSESMKAALNAVANMNQSRQDDLFPEMLAALIEAEKVLKTTQDNIKRVLDKIGAS